MVYLRHIIITLLASASTLVSADYDIDNANASIIYSMPPTATGQGWQTFSALDQQLVLDVTNSTGNYSIVLDASHCYNENYALGVCSTSQDCFVQIPFVGSGITMYVFNAGASGMSASFSIDGGTAVSNSIDGPSFTLRYQVPNVSLYDIQGLPSGNHSIRMTLLDWNGVATSMKFDYAHVNETFVAPPATTTSASSTTSQSSQSSQSSTSTSSPSSVSSKRDNVGALVGGTVGGLALLGLVTGCVLLRKRKSTRQAVLPPASTFHVNPTSEFSSSTLPPVVSHGNQEPLTSQYGERTNPHTRSAILRDVLAAGNHSSLPPDETSISSRPHSIALQPLRRQPSFETDDIRPWSMSETTPSTDSSRYNLKAEQVEIIDRLRGDNVPLGTISRVIEGFVTANLSADGTSDRGVSRTGSVLSGGLPPPSYRTRVG